MKGLRRDVEEIKEMLVPEAPSTKSERGASPEGGKSSPRARRKTGARFGSESLNPSCIVPS